MSTSVASESKQIPSPIRRSTVVQLLVGREAGGITSAIGQWIPSQIDAGWKHIALLLAPGATERELSKVGIETCIANGGRGMSTAERFRRLHSELHALNPDIVHVHNPASQCYAALARRRVDFQLVRTVHADTRLEMKHALSGPSRLFWNLMTRSAMKRTDAIVCIHEHVRDTLPVFARDRAVVIPNGLDVARIELSAAQTPADLDAWLGDRDTPMVLAVGRWVAIKRWDWLLKAWSRTASRMRAKLVLLGAGPDEERLRGLIHELGMNDSARLEGWMPDIAPALKRASLVVITSRSETGPLVLLEAMAASTATLSTPVGIVPDTMIDGVTGRLLDHPRAASGVDDADIDRLAKTIDDLFSDPDELRRMGSAARERLRGRYDHITAGAARADLYNQLLLLRRARSNS